MEWKELYAINASQIAPPDEACNFLQASISDYFADLSCAKAKSASLRNGLSGEFLTNSVKAS